MAERAAQVLWALDFLRNYGRPPADFLAEDFEVRQADTATGAAGLFVGPDALRAALSELAAGFEGLALDTEEVVEKPDGTVAVVVHLSGRDRCNGLEVHNTIGWLWTFEGDTAMRLQVFEDPEGALS